MTMLIFPSTHCEARKYYREAIAHGERVVCASEHNDGMCEDWVHLPNIRDPKFMGLLMQLIIEHHVHKIHTDSAEVYEILKARFPQRMLPSPAKVVQDYYYELLARALKVKSHLGVNRVAYLLKEVDSIYGESSHEKIVALIETFSDMPEGDAVEIGALFGKTAWLLAVLATRLTVIDPWQEEAAKQSGMTSASQWDWPAIRAAFDINMAFTGVRVNTDIRDKISLLHIDGNHDYAYVNSDWLKYGKNIVSGGWLVLDDYEWTYGDGPKRVGDIILQQDNIDRHFMAGGALFVKFK